MKWFESLEPRRLLTEAFAVHDIVAGDIDVFQPFDLGAADIDGDGHLDLLVSDAHPRDTSSGSIAWYRNIGDASFERKRIVDLVPSIAVEAADIDVDGDLDIVSTIAGELRGVVWYENVDGEGNFADPKLLVDSIARSIVTGDFDGDGDSDLVIGDDRRVRWLENDGGSGFVEQSLSDSTGSRNMETADINGDGLADVVIALRDGRLVAFPSTESGPFGAMEVLFTGSHRPGRSLGLAIDDFDGDSDLEIYFAYVEPSQTSSTLVHLDNFVDEVATRSQRLSINVTSLLSADPDSDGDLELLAFRNEVDGGAVWFEMTESGDVQESTVGFFPAAEFKLGVSANFNQDEGDDLVLAGGSPNHSTGPVIAPLPAFSAFIGMVRPKNPSGVPGLSYDIARQGDGVDFLTTGDLDGDGDLDFVSSSFWDDRVAWHNNLGDAKFSEENLVASVNRPGKTYVGDLDQDMDLDLVVPTGDGVFWYSNDGDGNFQLAGTLTESVATHAEPGDYDGDGDLDVLTVSLKNVFAEPSIVEVQVQQNNGDGTFTNVTVAEHQCGTVGCQSNGVASHFPATFVDLDADGDLDVVQQADDGVAWYRNTDSQFTFANAIEDPERAGQGPLRQLPPYAIDVDADGIPEIILSRLEVFDYDAETESWSRYFLDLGDTEIVDTFLRQSIPTDYDLDGDLDIVAMATRYSRESPDQFSLDAVVEELVILFENDGAGQLKLPVDLATIDPTDGAIPQTFVAADFDNDTDTDFVLGRTVQSDVLPFDGPYGGISFLENRLSGDANNDNFVDFADFLILSANFGFEEAVWERGDFNDDQIVDFADFLLLSMNFGKKLG